MIQCISTFMDLCYIFRRNVITATDLASADVLLKNFHQLRCVFITEGVRNSISLPRQHALSHYLTSIELFGSPNGLCSSITESKHIKAVKEPWRRSSRFKALVQMLRSITRLDKLAALRRRFLHEGLLVGSTAGSFAKSDSGRTADASDSPMSESDDDVGGSKEIKESQVGDFDERIGDVEPDSGPQSLSSIVLAAVSGTSSTFSALQNQY